MSFFFCFGHDSDKQHVLLEKPISIDLETARDVVKYAESKPELKVMVGFSRRCTLRLPTARWASFP
jgi:predicted dehydrogenase